MLDNVWPRHLKSAGSIPVDRKMDYPVNLFQNLFQATEADQKAK